MAKLTIEEIIEAVKQLTVIELNDLVTAAEEAFGVSAAAGVAVAATAVVAEEKTEFDVELTQFGEQKIKVVKVVKDVTGLGLKEAKDLVDGAPSIVKEGLSKDDAEALKAKLVEVGAVVTIK